HHRDTDHIAADQGWIVDGPSGRSMQMVDIGDGSTQKGGVRRPTPNDGSRDGTFRTKGDGDGCVRPTKGRVRGPTPKGVGGFAGNCRVLRGFAARVRQFSTVWADGSCAEGQGFRWENAQMRATTSDLCRDFRDIQGVHVTRLESSVS